MGGVREGDGEGGGGGASKVTWLCVYRAYWQVDLEAEELAFQEGLGMVGSWSLNLD